jgi:hypothetical protein
VKNEKCTLYDLQYGRKIEKTKKMRNTHFRTWIWQENRKTWKNIKAHFRTWNMASNTEKREKRETNTL